MTISELAARIEAAMCTDYASRSTDDRPLYGAEAIAEDGRVMVRHVAGWMVGSGWKPIHGWHSMSPEEATKLLAWLEGGNTVRDWRYDDPL